MVLFNAMCCMFYRRDPYARSKKAIDLTAVQLNKELSGKVCTYIFTVSSVLVCVMSE